MINTYIPSTQLSIHQRQSVKDAYLKYLNTERGTYIYNEFKKILYSKEDTLTKYLNHNYLLNFLKSRSGILKVGDIGGGDGRRVLNIMEFCYRNLGIKFQLDFIEQSSIFVRQFEKLLSERDTSFLDTVNITNNLFEKVELPPASYDVVLLIHSIFAFEKGKAVDKILSLRNTNGNVLVISNAAASFLGGLKEIIDDEYEDCRYEIEDLAQELKSKAINYQDYCFNTKWTINSPTNLITSPEIQVILEWISLGKYPTYSYSKKERLQEYIESKTLDIHGGISFIEEEIMLEI